MATVHSDEENCRKVQPPE